MYSHRSEYSSHRRQDADRSSGQWDQRPQTHSQYQWDVHHKTREDGPSSTERRSRTREFSVSPYRGSSRDSLNRDSDRRSPVRRRGSSPVSDAPVKRRRTCAEDQDFRYQHQSLEDSQPEDFRHSLPHGDEFQPRRTPPDVRSGHQRDEAARRERHEDSSDRSFSDCFSDEDFPKRRRDSSRERTGLPNRFTKKYPSPRERMGSPHTSVHYEDYQNRSSRQFSEGDVAPKSSSDPERKLSAGFQLFLDVLNMGVNVDALSKIVSQNSTEVDDEYISQSPLVGAADRSLSPGCPERRQKLRQHNNSSCGRATTPELPRRRSSGPNNTPAPDESAPQRSDGGRSLGSKSPSVEKIVLTPEEEAKRKQMQDVLQAIGVDLGLDELGQMTHRIQERLYGKKNDNQKVNQERRLSPRHRSRSSSSSGSSFSPPSQDPYETNSVDQRRPPRCLTELKQSAEYDRKINRSSFQDGEDKFEDKPAAVKVSAPKQALTQPLPVPVLVPAPAPPPPPVTSPTLPYPAHFPGAPPPVPSVLPPPFFIAPPPNFPPAPPPNFPPAPLPNFPPAPPPNFHPAPPRFFSPCPPPPFPPCPTPPPFAPRIRPGDSPPSMRGKTLLPDPFPPCPTPPPFAPRIRPGDFPPSMHGKTLLPDPFPLRPFRTGRLIPPLMQPFAPPPMQPFAPPPMQPFAPPHAYFPNIPEPLEEIPPRPQMNRCLLLVKNNQ